MILQPPLVGTFEKIWVCGGEGVYREALSHATCHRVYLTRIDAHFECDAFFPHIDDSRFKRITVPDVDPSVQEENGIQWEYQVWEKIG
jgi:dihydrofolate reductase